MLPEHQRKSRRGARRVATCLLFGCLALALTGCSGGMSGTFEEVGGTDTIEFRDSRNVYVTVFGTTIAGEYEVDGERVVIKYPNGSIVLTKNGDTLEGGPLGETYKKK